VQRHGGPSSPACGHSLRGRQSREYTALLSRRYRFPPTGRRGTVTRARLPVGHWRWIYGGDDRADGGDADADDGPDSRALRTERRPKPGTGEPCNWDGLRPILGAA